VNEPTTNPFRTARGRGFTAGLVLVVIGTIFLLHTFGVPGAGSVWPLILLVPAAASAASALVMIAEAGWRVTPAAVGPLAGCLYMLLLTAVFFFRLDWRQVWPGFLVIAGIVGLISAASWRHRAGGDSAAESGKREAVG